MKGGLVISCQNEIRDELSDLTSKALFPSVVRNKPRIQYEADDDDDLVGLVGEFTTSRLEGIKEDPGEWISRLEIMSHKMLALDPKYEKSDQEIIAHAFSHLPKVHESTINARCNNRKKNSLRRK
jgi:hypothetical protein